MKPNLTLIIILASLSSACGSDLLETTEDPVETTSASGIGEGDFISESEFNRTVSIAWTDGCATVSGDTDGFVSVNGTRVTVNSTADTTKVVKYVLSGTCSDGSLKLYSLRKQALVLNGLRLSNSGGAAIDNQSDKRTFVVVEGENALQDGLLNDRGDYPDATEGEDLKAAFFSEGQLVFSGSGSLSVTARGKAGITSDDYLRFVGTQTIEVTSETGHALRGKDAVRIDDGTIAATAKGDGKKGISSDGPVTLTGGTVRLSAQGGVLAETTGTGTELSGAAGIKSDGLFTMSGGKLEITASGQGGKGISGDGNAVFEGGTVSVRVTGSNYGSSVSGGPGGPGGRPGTRAGWGSGQDSTTDTSKGAKGIKFDGDMTISGGVIEVVSTNNEALESKGKLTVTGGIVYAFSQSDDAINSGGDMNLSGGLVCGWSSGNDGIDANGNLYINGASVYAVTTKGNPEVALDANTEGGKKLFLQSGSLIAIGGIESGASITGTAYSTSSWSKGAWHALYDDEGKLVFATKAPSSSSNNTMVVYADGKGITLQGGVSVNEDGEIWAGCGCTGLDVSGGSAIALSSYSPGGGMFR